MNRAPRSNLELDRESYESQFPMPDFVKWDGHEYVVKPGYENSHEASCYIHGFEVWLAALCYVFGSEG